MSMKKKIWPTRNLYFESVDPEQLRAHQPKPTASESARERLEKTSAAQKELYRRTQKAKSEELSVNSGEVSRRSVVRKRRRDRADGDWHVMINDK